MKKNSPGHAIPQTAAGWTFLTNHSHVLLLIAAMPDARMRDLALRVGITERAVQRIIEDMAEAGYLKVFKEGRRNTYEVVHSKRLRHSVEGHCTIGDLIDFVGKPRI
jgi:DNA-binding Xre family transcriptional regulator